MSDIFFFLCLQLKNEIITFERQKNLGLVSLSFLLSFNFLVCQDKDLEIHFKNETSFTVTLFWTGFFIRSNEGRVVKGINPLLGSL